MHISGTPERVQASPGSSLDVFEGMTRKAKPSSTEFTKKASEAITAAEKDGKPFSAEMKRQLEAFARAAYQVNIMMSGGRDDCVAAKLALAYELGRQQYHQDTDVLFQDSYAFAATRHTPYEIGMESLEEIVDLTRNTGYALGILDTRDARNVEPYKDLLRTIHKMRQGLMVGASLGEFARQHPYFPLIAAIYAVTQDIVAKKGFTPDNDTAAGHSFLQKITGGRSHSLAEYELGALAFQLPFAEQPPNDLVAADFQTRTYWERMINTGVRDYLLRNYFPEAADFMDNALAGATGITGYAERVIGANSIHMQNLFPRMKENTIASQTARPAFSEGLRVGYTPFWDKGKVGGMRSFFTYEPTADARILDAVIGKNEPKHIQLQQSGIKSMWEILGKTLKDETIAHELMSLAKSLKIPIPSEVMKDVTSNKLPLVVQGRISLFTALLRGYKKDSRVIDLTRRIRESVMHTSDMVRGRAFLKGDGALDRFCSRELADDPDAFVLLWKPGDIVETPKIQELLAKGESIEKLLDTFHQGENTNNPNFAAVFVHRHVKIPGSSKTVTVEYQVGREKDARTNWLARQEYKLHS